jgi:hypothetical protein
VGHVLARLNGYGIQLVPHWPYRFEHVADVRPETVAVVRLTPEGEVRAVIDARRPTTVDCVVDVTREPSPDGWRVETSLYSIPWPEGFHVASPTDPDDHINFYLEGVDGSAIFPQGPTRTERLPTGVGWAADGQRIINETTTDDAYVIELEYEHEGRPWWQSHWLVPWGAQRTLVFSAQCPAGHTEATRLAAEYLASEVWPT